MKFWNRDTEISFFREGLKNATSPEQLFYHLKDGYFAYAPKGKTTEGKTLQSRNSLIGQYTEKWCKDFFQPIANNLGLFAVNSVVCPELGLTNSTDADVAFCTSEETNQKAENIKLREAIEKAVLTHAYSIIDIDFPERGFLLFWQMPAQDKMRYFDIEEEIANLKNEDSSESKQQKLDTLINPFGANPIQKIEKAFFARYKNGIKEYIWL